MEIIGFTGPKGSGKTAAAKALASLGYRRMSFADPIKRVLQIIYAFSDDQLYGESKEIIDVRYGLTPRFMMQRFGTEVCRVLHPDTWVLALERGLDSLSTSKVVIDDVRFKNEVEFIHRKGGLVVYIHRILDTGEDYHDSEAGVRHLADFTVKNSDSLEDFQVEVTSIMRDLRWGN